MARNPFQAWQFVAIQIRKVCKRLIERLRIGALGWED